MTNKASEIQENAAALIEQTVLPVMERVVANQQKFSKDIQEQLDTFIARYDQARKQSEPRLFFEAWVSFTQDIDRAISSRYDKPLAPKVDEIFDEYATVKKSFVGGLPVTFQEVQAEDRFITSDDDNWRIRRVKAWKRSTRGLRRTPLHVGNAFRKLFRKEAKVAEPWSYRVPLRNLTAYYYIEVFTVKLAPTLEKIYHGLATTSQELWEATDQVYTQVDNALQSSQYQQDDWLAQLPDIVPDKRKQAFDTVAQELDELLQEVKQDVARTIEAVHQQFQYTYDRVGTAELSASKFSNRQLKKERGKTDRVFFETVQGWRNTLFALYDDWRIDEEFSTLCNQLLYEHYKLREEANAKVKQSVIPQVNTAQRLIQNAMEAIEAADPKDTEQVLQAQKLYVDEQLIRTIIPATIATLYRQALPALLENIQKEAATQVNKLPEKRGLVKATVYNRMIKTSEIDYVSPRQIVSFETLPNLKKSIEQSKALVAQELAHIQKLINEIGQISYFNLDSALSVYEGEQESVAKAQEIALEGLQRAVKGKEGIRKDLDDIYRHLDEDVLLAVRKFNTQLHELKRNDYALEIKIRVAKARAMEQTQAFKQKSIDYLRNAVPYSLRFVQNNYALAQQQVSSYRKMLGIAPNSDMVSTAISDFLTETEKSIQQLPYVYQRLFSIRPLEEAVFYEERTAELKEMQQAFQNWGRGHYASTVVVGEKGSGITTLINFFLKQTNQKLIKRCHVIRAQQLYQLHREEELLDYLKAFFPDTPIASVDDLVVHLQQAREPTIFALENLEHFYLRKVGGFTGLKMLFEIISKTNHQVFWLCSCTLYTWRYLEKTVRIADYFEYIVTLQPIESQQLKEVILKRHRVSGYQVQYEAAPEDKARKKFQKLNQMEQQQYLEDEYFAKLNRITSGNFSIAQLFWMRSTRKVTEDTIYINSLKQYDFSFVKTIPLHHTLTLHNLLLHDGLRESQYQELVEYLELGPSEASPTAKSNLNLIQLLDDGFIVKKEEAYLVNPLLYRQVVEHLQTTNFLH